MQFLLNGQASSGLSVKQYCKEHHVSEAVFYYWQKKLKGEKAAKVSRAGFKKIAVNADNKLFSEYLFAEYKGIRFYQEPSVSFLKQLIG